MCNFVLSKCQSLMYVWYINDCNVKYDILRNMKFPFFQAKAINWTCLLAGETNLVSFLPPMTSNLSPACNMSLTQYVPLLDRPATIVQGTKLDDCPRHAMIFSVPLFADCVENRAHTGWSPVSHDHGAVRKFKSERCRRQKLKGKLATRLLITRASWPPMQAPFT